MTAEAQSMARVLLDHHRGTCAPGKSIDSCTIPYSRLCERAGIPYLTHSVGHFLVEVAEWCVLNGWPPLNALAVNKDSRMPGLGYDGAPGCTLEAWPAEVRAAIDFGGYPREI